MEDSSQLRQPITFVGTATGGSLVIGDSYGPVPIVLAVSTRHGDSADVVVERVASALNSTPIPMGAISSPSAAVAEADGATLITAATIGFTAGTERGLGIPPPPLFLTADWNVPENEVILRWENSASYQSIKVLLPVLGPVIPGAKTDFTLDLRAGIGDPSVADYITHYLEEYGHILCRLLTEVPGNRLPSGVAEIELRQRSMAEIYRVPFSGGVATNWRAWHDQERDPPVFRQETRWDPNEHSRREVIKPHDAPYYQVIEAQSEEVDGGLYRKFLGLRAGQRYKLNMRLQPRKEGSGAEPVLTVNALCSPSALGSLTAEQMTGKVKLPAAPDGAHFSLEVPFQQKNSPKWWQLDKLKYVEPDTTTVTMLEGCDTLHVWLRLQSNGAHATVGMDWVELSKID